MDGDDDTAAPTRSSGGRTKSCPAAGDSLKNGAIRGPESVGGGGDSIGNGPALVDKPVSEILDVLEVELDGLGALDAAPDSTTGGLAGKPWRLDKRGEGGAASYEALLHGRASRSAASALHAMIADASGFSDANKLAKSPLAVGDATHGWTEEQAQSIGSLGGSISNVEHVVETRAVRPASRSESSGEFFDGSFASAGKRADGEYE